MDMQEFYDFHGITRARFARMIGVNATALCHYELGHRVSEETRPRIEIGIDIFEDCKVIYHNPRPNAKYDEQSISYEESRNNERFNKAFQRVILIEL